MLEVIIYLVTYFYFCFVNRAKHCLQHFWQISVPPSTIYSVLPQTQILEALTTVVSYYFIELITKSKDDFWSHFLYKSTISSVKLQKNIVIEFTNSLDWGSNFCFNNGFILFYYSGQEWTLWVIFQIKTNWNGRFLKLTQNPVVTAMLIRTLVLVSLKMYH